ncbi:hypothetical protein ACI2OX_02525 [Bacillus sp. N9]
MKKYFIIRILILFMYVACLWYGLKVRTNFGYTIVVVGVLIGLVLNYINYRVNYKPLLQQQKNNPSD